MKIHEYQAKEILKTKKRLNELLAANTGQSFERIENDAERDYWMSGDEARTYGLIDEVIVSKKAPEKKTS